MKKGRKNSRSTDMLPEYDFGKGIRGKYAKRYQRGTNVVILEPDVARIFRSADAVNTALRSLAAIIHQSHL